jgi:hypothetical protein
MTRFIVMADDSVRLLKRGLKTQTRRLMNPQPTTPDPLWQHGISALSLEAAAALSPVYGKAGDRLWVRETHSVEALTVYPCPVAWYRADFDEFDACGGDPNNHIRGCAAETTGIRDAACIACAMNGARFRWRSPRYMAKRLSRITLQITRVRVQRLQDITDDDAIAEGCARSPDPDRLGGDFARWSYGARNLPGQCMNSPRMAYANAWNRIHGGPRWNIKPGPCPWDENPWVWSVSFRSVS